jgi:hypothetical protein
MVDIDAEELGKQPRHVLTDVVVVRVGGAVARSNVEHPILAEDKAATVVTV